LFEARKQNSDLGAITLSENGLLQYLQSRRLLILGRRRNLKMAFIASEDAFSGCAGDRIEARSGCLFDPTPGALEMSVDFRLKSHKALSREFGRIQTRLYVRLPCLQQAQLLLIVISAHACLLGKLVCELR
jgi:hypothetical protein